MQPHVLALQEIGPEPALVALRQRLDWELPHRALGQPDQRGISVAYLSKRVLRDIEHIDTFPPGLLPVQTGDDPTSAAGPATMNGLARGALKVTVRAAGLDVHIVNCHLKSKLLTFPGGRFSPRNESQRSRFAAYALYRRTSEAATLRQYATDLLAHNDPVIVTGDFKGCEEDPRGILSWCITTQTLPDSRSSRRNRLKTSTPTFLERSADETPAHSCGCPQPCGPKQL